ncbi:MAG: hypothetical protein QM586_06805 [Xenophilus sp.]
MSGKSTNEGCIITPESGWTRDTMQGHMAFEAGPAGRLVLLRDVVTWLMGHREIPCRYAVDAVCDELAVAGAQAWLYIAKRGDFAKPLDGAHSFAAPPMVLGLGGAADTGSRLTEPEDCGLCGAMKWMRNHWGRSSSPTKRQGLGRDMLDLLCIRMDKAHELWDWGTLAGAEAGAADGFTGTTYADVQAYRKGNKGARWCGAQRSLVKEEVERRTASTVAEELGMSRAALKKQTDQACARSALLSLRGA